MELRDGMGLKHDTDDPRCRYNDGVKIGFLTRLVMGICCNTCRSLPPVPKFIEVTRVELKTGEMIYVNDVLYRFVEQSHVVDSDGTSSRIVLESMDTSKGFMHLLRRQDDFGGAMPQTAQDLPSSVPHYRVEDI